MRYVKHYWRTTETSDLSYLLNSAVPSPLVLTMLSASTGNLSHAFRKPGAMRSIDGRHSPSGSSSHPSSCPIQMTNRSIHHAINPSQHRNMEQTGHGNSRDMVRLITYVGLSHLHVLVLFRSIASYYPRRPSGQANPKVTGGTPQLLLDPK